MRSTHLELDVTPPNDVQREFDAMPMMTDAMALATRKLLGS
jgi:hypothetical protein